MDVPSYWRNLEIAERCELVLATFGVHPWNAPEIHWYSGSLDDLRPMLTRGLYFTIGVEVLYSEHIRTIAKQIPPAQLLTETDNPVGAKWLTGTAGMPRVIEDVVNSLAEVRGTTVDVIEQTVQANFARLIRHDRRLTGTHRRFFEGQPARG